MAGCYAPFPAIRLDPLRSPSSSDSWCSVTLLNRYLVAKTALPALAV